jgi:hypothetical protein
MAHFDFMSDSTYRLISNDIKNKYEEIFSSIMTAEEEAEYKQFLLSSYLGKISGQGISEQQEEKLYGDFEQKLNGVLQNEEYQRILNLYVPNDLVEYRKNMISSGTNLSYIDQRHFANNMNEKQKALKASQLTEAYLIRIYKYKPIGGYTYNITNSNQLNPKLSFGSEDPSSFPYFTYENTVNINDVNSISYNLRMLKKYENLQNDEMLQMRINNNSDISEPIKTCITNIMRARGYPINDESLELWRRQYQAYLYIMLWIRTNLSNTEVSPNQQNIQQNLNTDMNRFPGIFGTDRQLKFGRIILDAICPYLDDVFGHLLYPMGGLSYFGNNQNEDYLMDSICSDASKFLYTICGGGTVYAYIQKYDPDDIEHWIPWYKYVKPVINILTYMYLLCLLVGWIFPPAETGVAVAGAPLVAAEATVVAAARVTQASVFTRISAGAVSLFEGVSSAKNALALGIQGAIVENPVFTRLIGNLTAEQILTIGNTVNKWSLKVEFLRKICEYTIGTVRIKLPGAFKISLGVSSVPIITNSYLGPFYEQVKLWQKHYYEEKGYNKIFYKNKSDPVTLGFWKILTRSGDDSLYFDAITYVNSNYKLNITYQSHKPGFVSCAKLITDNLSGNLLDSNTSIFNRKVALSTDGDYPNNFIIGWNKLTENAVDLYIVFDWRPDFEMDFPYFNLNDDPSDTNLSKKTKTDPILSSELNSIVKRDAVKSVVLEPYLKVYKEKVRKNLISSFCRVLARLQESKLLINNIYFSGWRFGGILATLATFDLPTYLPYEYNWKADITTSRAGIVLVTFDTPYIGGKKQFINYIWGNVNAIFRFSILDIPDMEKYENLGQSITCLGQPRNSCYRINGKNIPLPNFDPNQATVIAPNVLFYENEIRSPNTWTLPYDSFFTNYRKDAFPSISFYVNNIV